VEACWQHAGTWTERQLPSSAELVHQDAADLLYRLALSADTASEILVRTHAAAATIHKAGWAIQNDALGCGLTLAYGESRPYQWPSTVDRAAQLADAAADPRQAALIALSAIYASPLVVRRANVGSVSADGALVWIPWGGGVRAVPPQLRTGLAARRDQLIRAGKNRTDPMFPGTSHGRTTTPAIRRTLTGLDAPASLWEPPTSLYDDLDGRTLLHGLNRHHLFPPPEPQAQ